MMAALAGWRMLPVHTTYGGFYFSVAVDALIFGTLWIAYELIGRRIHLAKPGRGRARRFDRRDARHEHRDAGDSFIFTWPLLFATLAMSYRPRSHDARIAIIALVALVAGNRDAGADRSPGAPTARSALHDAFRGVGGPLLFGLFIPYIDFLTSGRRWIVPGVLGLLALVMIIKGNAASDFDASQPHPDSIFYFQDTDRERARWVSLDSRPDRFTAQFFQHHVLGGWLPKLVGLATRETPDQRPRAHLARLLRSESRPHDRRRRAPHQRAAAHTQSARRLDHRRHAHGEDAYRVGAQGVDRLDVSAGRRDRARQLDRRQIAGRSRHRRMDRMVLGTRRQPASTSRSSSQRPRRSSSR